MLGTAILIKPDKLPERTDSGMLIIPRSSKEMLKDWGTVEQVGSACKDVRVGERVIFHRKQASVIIIDNTEFYITNEHRIEYHV